MSVEPGPHYPILVVDDVRDERAAVSKVLEAAGYSTRSVQSGEAALDCAGAERLSLVVLDICLPGISGYEVCRCLKDRFGDALPILLFRQPGPSRTIVTPAGSSAAMTFWPSRSWRTSSSVELRG